MAEREGREKQHLTENGDLGGQKNVKRSLYRKVLAVILLVAILAVSGILARRVISDRQSKQNAAIFSVTADNINEYPKEMIIYVFSTDKDVSQRGEILTGTGSRNEIKFFVKNATGNQIDYNITFEASQKLESLSGFRYELEKNGILLSHNTDIGGMNVNGAKLSEKSEHIYTVNWYRERIENEKNDILIPPGDFNKYYLIVKMKLN